MKKKRTVAAQAAARGPLPDLPKELLDELVKGPMTPNEVQDLMLAFNKAIIERAMGAEMNMHLGYRPGEAKPPEQANERNGASGKTIITDRGPVRVDLPRDRDGSFEPILIPKHERRFTGFDERIIAMYARGMSVREIQGFLAESYGTEVSPDFISSVTDEVNRTGNRGGCLVKVKQVPQPVLQVADSIALRLRPAGCHRSSPASAGG
jgi:putative transposase